MQTKTILGWVLLTIIVCGGIIWLAKANRPTPNNSSDLAGFAQCLKDKKVTFYGAFWCPHCQAQKALFGSAAKLLPYVECSTPDANGQTQICKDQKIESYPTWEFADGTRRTGEVPLLDLASTTGCVLPNATSTTTNTNAIATTTTQ